MEGVVDVFDNEDEFDGVVEVVFIIIIVSTSDWLEVIMLQEVVVVQGGSGTMVPVVEHDWWSTNTIGSWDTGCLSFADEMMLDMVEVLLMPGLIVELDTTTDIAFGFV